MGLAYIGRFISIFVLLAGGLTAVLWLIILNGTDLGSSSALLARFAPWAEYPAQVFDRAATLLVLGLGLYILSDIRVVLGRRPREFE